VCRIEDTGTLVHVVHIAAAQQRRTQSSVMHPSDNRGGAGPPNVNDPEPAFRVTPPAHDVCVRRRTSPRLLEDVIEACLDGGWRLALMRLLVVPVSLPVLSGWFHPSPASRLGERAMRWVERTMLDAFMDKAQPLIDQLSHPQSPSTTTTTR
jgi:hypothetical protein